MFKNLLQNGFPSLRPLFSDNLLEKQMKSIAKHALSVSLAGYFICDKRVWGDDSPVFW
jgi:hypothetical protein